MILVDTNVIIDYWKKPKNEWTSIFKTEEIATCGIIITELLRGCDSDNQKQNIKKALDCFEYLNFETEDWVRISDLFINLRKAGISVPFQDGVIAYLSLKNNCKIWSHDKHFEYMKHIIPEIQLFIQ